MAEYHENKDIHHDIDKAIDQARNSAKKRNENNSELYYHYMTKDTLEIILNNKSFRLSRLDKVRNDETEFDRVMNANNAQKMFVGCFTNTPEENKYFWEEYAQKEKGVRLGFNKLLFNTTKVYYIPCCDNNRVLIPTYEQWEKGNDFLRWHQTMRGLDMLDMIYSDGDLFYTNPNSTYVQESINNGHPIIKETVTIQLCNIYHIGHVKNKNKWSKECETRVRMFLEKGGSEVPDFEHIYLPFEDETFSEFEILFNPWMKSKEKNEIMKIAQDILPNSKITFKNSELSY